MPGHFALILRAHLPFVRHPEDEHFLGKSGWFEAITETYVPLLRMMERLVDDLCLVSGAGLSRRSM
jgi:1,4-alpha-glucan branching enzyme